VSLHGHAMSRLLNRSARIFSALNVDSLRRRERERETSNYYERANSSDKLIVIRKQYAAVFKFTTRVSNASAQAASPASISRNVGH